MKKAATTVLLLAMALCVGGPIWPRRAEVGGGGGGAFTFVESVEGTSDGSSTTVDANSSTLDLQEGDLLIAFVGYEGTATTVSANDQGSNTLTFDTGDDVSNGDANLYPLYMTSVGTANGTATIRATLGAARSWKRIVVMQYRPSSGTTSKDISGTRENTGTDFGSTTGTFSTTGSYGVVCAGTHLVAGPGWISATINSVAADQVDGDDTVRVWCRILAASLSSVTGTVQSSSNGAYAATAIAFKSE